MSIHVNAKIVNDDVWIKFSIEENTKKSFDAGCNIALHCNGNMNEMIKVAKNSPKINKFILNYSNIKYLLRERM